MHEIFRKSVWKFTFAQKGESDLSLPQHCMKLSITAPSLLLALGATVPVFGQGTFIQAPLGPGGTWNIYQFEFGGLTQKNANITAAGRLDPVMGNSGHVVAIQSAAENNWVWLTMNKGDIWIGLSDREGVAPGASESQVTGNPSTLGWRWTSGEALTFTNWGGGEPNDWNGAEDAAHIRNDSLWNDNGSGYGANDPGVPVISPGTSNDESAGPVFKWAVEYNTASPTPMAGVRMPQIFNQVSNPITDTPLYNAWLVREVRGLTQTGFVYDAVDQAYSGAGAITNGTLPILDVADPDTNGSGGPIITATSPQPYLTNTGGTDDDNILTSAYGRIQVVEGGQYTFQVRADDGFALRIRGATFTGSGGDGYIDPFDSSTMVYPGGTGDANTRAVVNLAPGEYDIDFINWEGAGGAYYEVTSAKGDFTAGGTAQWLPVGAQTDMPFINETNAVRLSAPANVATAAGTQSTIAGAISQTDAAIAANTAATGTTNLVVLRDPDDICCSRPGAAIYGQSVQLPNPGSYDNYTTKVWGGLTVNDGDGTAGETITLTFGIFSDDGSALHILGQNFNAVSDFTGDGNASLMSIAGDQSLAAEYPTGNTNAFGRIDLVEGNYNFEGFSFEGGGDSGFEIWYAVGDFLGSGFNASAFRPLSTDTGFTVAGNPGLRLVPEPGSVTLLAFCGLLAFRRRRK